MLALLPDWLWHPLGQCAGDHAEVIRCKSYNAWSGSFSDISEITLIVTVVAGLLGAYRLWRKHTECHVTDCSKHGHVIHGTPYRACHDHDKRVTHTPGEPITADHIAEAIDKLAC